MVLPCSAPPGTDLDDVVLEWTRADLDRDYMFLFRDGRPYLVHQHPQFKDRVELQEPSLRNGNLSVVLRGVAERDSGRYECHVVGHSRVSKRSLYNTEPIRTIDLKVHEPAPAEPEKIRAFPGQDVVLPVASVDFPVTSGMWKRADDIEHFVFLFGMGHPHHQHPQYQDRVQLQNRNQNQTRDLSVILREVQPRDNGTYHFHIVQSQRRMKRDLIRSKPHQVVILEVASAAFRFQAGVGFVAAVFISVALQILP